MKWEFRELGVGSWELIVDSEFPLLSFRAERGISWIAWLLAMTGWGDAMMYGVIFPETSAVNAFPTDGGSFLFPEASAVNAFPTKSVNRLPLKSVNLFPLKSEISATIRGVPPVFVMENVCDSEISATMIFPKLWDSGVIVNAAGASGVAITVIEASDSLL